MGFVYSLRSFLKAPFINAGEDLYKGISFVVKFAVFLILSYALLYFLPPGIKEKLTALTTTGTVYLGKALFLKVNVLPTPINWPWGDLITVDGYRINIVFDCTALNYLFIFMAGVIAYPAERKEKLYGLFIGLPFIIFLNFFRIVFIAWFGAHFPAQVDFVHRVFWEWTFFFAVIAVWWGWISYGGFVVRGLSGLQKKSFSIPLTIWLRAFCLLALVFLLFTGYDLLTSAYLEALAVISGLFMKIAGIDTVVRAEDHGIIVSNWITFVPSVLEICLFTSLTICFSRTDRKRKLAIRFASGVAIIMLIHIGVILVTYLDIRDMAPDRRILNTMRAVIPLSPFFVWLLLNATDIIQKNWIVPLVSGHPKDEHLKEASNETLD